MGLLNLRLVLISFLAFFVGIISPLLAGEKAPPATVLTVNSSHISEDAAKTEIPTIRSSDEREAGEFVFSDLNLKVKPLCLTPQKRSILDAIRNQGALRFEALTNLLVEDQRGERKEGGIAHEELLESTRQFAALTNLVGEAPKEERKDIIALPDMHSMLDRLANVKNPKDLPSLKKMYEEALELTFASKTKYNSDASNLAEVCSSNRLNCFSGTVLNQVVTRKALGAKEFERQRPVVVYEEGHVLPGFMVQTADGWKFVGMESTVKGKAVKGPWSVGELDRPMKIYDASDWILFQIFKSCLEDPRGLANEMMSRTTRKYGISPTAQKLAEEIDRRTTYGKHSSDGDPLGFGIPPEQPGDRDRDEKDEISPQPKQESKKAYGDGYQGYGYPYIQQGYYGSGNPYYYPVYPGQGYPGQGQNPGQYSERPYPH